MIHSLAARSRRRLQGLIALLALAWLPALAPSAAAFEDVTAEANAFLARLNDGGAVAMADQAATLMVGRYHSTEIPVAGASPYICTVPSGTLPAGLTYVPGSVGCQLSGTPSSAGRFAFTLRVQASNGQTTVQTNDYVVLSALAIAPDTFFLPATSGVAVNYSFSASGGTAPYTLSVTGLPPGLNFNPATGQVSGVLTGSGTLPFSITATDSSPTPFRETRGYAFDLKHPPAISIADVTMPEGGGGAVTSFAFAVTLSHAGTNTVSVDYATADGTATAGGDDYTPASGTLTFAPGEREKFIHIDVLGDDVVEPDETFVVNLSGEVGGVIARGQGVATIASDDVPDEPPPEDPDDPLPEIRISPARMAEPPNGSSRDLAFEVTLNRLPSRSLSVNYETADVTASAAAGDYNATSGTLTFAPGERSKTINVQINGDLVFEREESFALILSSPVNATIRPPGRVEGFIEANGEPPFVRITGRAQDEGDSGTSIMSLPISMSWPVDHDITFVYSITGITASVADGDYVEPTHRAVTIPAGSTEGSVDVVINGDTKVERDETFRVDIWVNDAQVVFLPDTDTAFGMIVNDDIAQTPKLSITAATGSAEEGAPGAGGRLVFNIQMSEPSIDTVFFDLEIVDGAAQAPGDYVAQRRTMGIVAGQTSNMVIVELVGDTMYEPDETLFVRISNPAGATIDVAEATGTILNDDEPPAVSVGDVTLVEGDSGTTVFSFPVTLSEISGYDTTVDFATADGIASSPADYVATSGTITIPAGSTSAVIDVQVNGDETSEPDETFTVNLTNPVHATIAKGRGVGLITNDDARSARLRSCPSTMCRLRKGRRATRPPSRSRSASIRPIRPP